jgi:hypothetical protein
MLLTALIFIGVIQRHGGHQECANSWKAPEIHGIRLGMTVKQVKSRLQFLDIPPADKYDVRVSFLYVTTNPTQRKRLPRVFEIEMWFLKNRLIQYNVGYYGPKQPESVDQFVDQVVRNLKLSEEMKVSYRRYECGNISVSVGEENRREISLLDLRAKPILDKRVEESYRKT